MNLDDAIKHCEEVAEENYGKATAYLSDTRVYEYEEQKYLKRADEHMQLAEWLKDYKRLLEQEPSVSENPNNCDLISRQAVLDKFQWHSGDESNKYLTLWTFVENMPSVNPQKPTGHWIIMGDRYIKCSECGHITKTESPDIYNFCMVCGANMSENPTSSKPEISSFYGLRSYVRERSEE